MAPARPRSSDRASQLNPENGNITAAVARVHVGNNVSAVMSAAVESRRDK